MITNTLNWCYDLTVLLQILWHYQDNEDGDREGQLSQYAQKEELKFLKTYLLLYFMA